MKKKIIALVLLIGISLTIAFTFFNKKEFTKATKNVANTWIDSLKEGDIIFQINIAGQGKAIQLATHSRYTHVAILFKENKDWMVYEAVEPVRKIALQAFINHGDSCKFVVKRMINADSILTFNKLKQMKIYAEQQIDKHYDIYFGWNDYQLYCSELVWKCYNSIAISIGPLKTLKSFDLSHPIVKSIMTKRYGTKIPLNETVISPGDIFNNPELKTVYQN